MALYTTELRRICEAYAGQTTPEIYAGTAETIEAARTKLFSFPYPIFDPNYKKVLETKIIRHYYTREIAHETVGRFKFRLETVLNEIMPYYNKLYESELLEFNPLHDFSVTRTRQNSADSTNNSEGTTAATLNSTIGETREGGADGDTTSTRNGNSATNNGMTFQNSTGGVTTRMDLTNDMPQGGVTDLEDLRYLSKAEKITDSKSDVSSGREDNTGSVISTDVENAKNKTSTHETVSGTNEQSSTGNSAVTASAHTTEDYLESVSGKQSGVSYAELIMKYRESFLNIDMSIIKDLGDLFFNLY